MIITVLTLFPQQVKNFMNVSVIGNAIQKGIIDLRCVDIRDFSVLPHRKVDDTLYGGGKGMLLACDPVFQAWKHAVNESCTKPRTIYLTPKGCVLNQSIVSELSKHEHIVFICGHYEGIDQRVIDRITDEEISIGDYVLTGGEVAACVVIDAVSRLIDGVLPDASAFEKESHMTGMLESPHYTKPDVWEGMPVPEVLKNGNHAKIEKWRESEGIYETYKKRPDLFHALPVSAEQWQHIIQREINDREGDAK